jgi:putative SOS response-associated peptidase YedK
MCGRYTYKLTWAEIVNLYRLTLPEEEPPGLKPSYNVTPTHVMPRRQSHHKLRRAITESSWARRPPADSGTPPRGSARRLPSAAGAW